MRTQTHARTSRLVSLTVALLHLCTAAILQCALLHCRHHSFSQDGELVCEADIARRAPPADMCSSDGSDGGTCTDEVGISHATESQEQRRTVAGEAGGGRAQRADEGSDGGGAEAEEPQKDCRQKFVACVSAGHSARGCSKSKRECERSIEK